MKQFFIAAALVAGTAISAAAQAEVKTLGCEGNDGSHNFKLTFDTATNKGTLDGIIQMPWPSSHYEFAPVVHVTEDPVYQDFSLMIEDHNIPGRVSPAVVIDTKVHEEFDMGTKDYVKIYMNGTNINGYDTVICPVPTRAMGLD